MNSKKQTPVILLGIDAAVGTLTEKYLANGSMPNFKRLISQGAYTRATSVFPGVTPINWATICTGAYPGTHGITDFSVLNPGDPLNRGRDGFLRETIKAEPIWEAALQQGLKCATLDFPGADSRQHPNHLWVAERGSPAGITQYALRNLSCFVTPGLDLRDAQQMEKKDNTFSFKLNPQYETGEGPLLTFEIRKNIYDLHGVSMCGLAGDDIFLEPDSPSCWLWADFFASGEKRRASFRLELTHFDPETESFAIYVSQVCAPEMIADPPDMGSLLVERLGPFVGYDGARAVDRGWVGPHRMVDEGYYKALWQANAAKLLVQDYEYDLVLIKWHLIDHIQHAFWGGIDPLSPWYGRTDHDHCESLISSAYQAADAMVGMLLPLVEQGATLAVVSDHGHIPHLKAAALNNLLLKEGLISLLPGDLIPSQADWKKTQAYGGPALGHIRINLCGRQPQGCVAPEDFEVVRLKVINLLENLRDPDTNQRIIERVMRRENAAPIGLWGDRVGDIVYWMTPGYSGDFNWTPLAREGDVLEDLVKEREGFADYGEGRFVADKFQSVHGCGDPAAQLGVGTEEAILAMAGPAIKTGASLKEIPNLTCVTPTLCAATGLPLPLQSEGQSLGEWILK